MSQGVQQPLEFSRGMLVAIGIVLLVSWVSQQDRSRSRRDITRVSGESLAFDKLGISVSPDHGWSHLSNVDPSQATRPVFTNVAENLIARLHHFPFKSWPPSDAELANQNIQPRASDESDDQASITELPVDTARYQQVGVEWLRVDRRRTSGGGFLVGRLRAEGVDLMVTVMIHSGEEAVENTAIQQFCDTIGPLN